MKVALFFTSACLLILLPYGILFTQVKSITVKLLYVSIIEIAVLGLLGTLFYVTDQDIFLAILIWYNFFMAISLTLNGILIALIWFQKRRKRLGFLGNKG
jgi:hypothetical protein